jgi:RNA polymerase sigma-70 factor (ECF subfamily)
MSERSAPLQAEIDAVRADRFDALYQRHYPPIQAYCRRRTRPERVDDAVAETFLVAWQRIDDVPDGREALLWLYRVAQHVVGHQWRSATRRSRLGTRLVSVRSAPSPGPEDRAVLDDECRLVLDAIGHLKPADSELLLLVAWEHLSNADLASVLDVGPDAVRQRLSRARKRLAHEYDRLAARSDRSPAAPEGGAR